jgi:hypothetical protein
MNLQERFRARIREAVLREVGWIDMALVKNQQDFYMRIALGVLGWQDALGLRVRGHPGVRRLDLLGPPLLQAGLPAAAFCAQAHLMPLTLDHAAGRMFYSFPSRWYVPVEDELVCALIFHAYGAIMPWREQPDPTRRRR